VRPAVARSVVDRIPRYEDHEPVEDRAEHPGEQGQDGPESAVSSPSARVQGDGEREHPPDERDEDQFAGHTDPVGANGPKVPPSIGRVQGATADSVVVTGAKASARRR